jgi:hypothetical protein
VIFTGQKYGIGMSNKLIPNSYYLYEYIQKNTDENTISFNHKLYSAHIIYIFPGHHD